MFKLISQYIKGTAVACAVFAPVFMFLEVFMDLQQPTLMADIVNNGVANADMHYVLATGLRMIICSLLGLLGGVGCCFLACFTAVSVSGHLRTSLFAKIQTLSFTELDELKTASLITRMTNDVVQLQHMVMMLLRGMIRSPLLCIGGIFMSFRLSPRLAVIFCVVLPILIACTVLVLTKTIPLYTKMQGQIDSVNTVMRENLLGVRVVKAFTMERKQLGRFSEVNAGLVDISIRAQSATFLLMPIVTLVMNISVVAILWLGGNMEVAGTVEAGTIMAFVNYMMQITNSLVMLVNLFLSFSRAQASAKRITEVFAKESSVSEPEKPLEPQGFDIEFKDVSFRYGTGAFVLKNISLTLKQGQRVGIIGTTGCGKSTLVSLIPRLYDTTHGSVSIGGVDVRNISFSVLRESVGVVLQESLLFSGSIGDNLRFGDSGASDDELFRAAEISQAREFIGDLNSRVEQRAKNFSGGQKQRLSITRTLLKKPKILILDDSASAVDLDTEAKMQAGIREGMTGSTIILIAQRISTVMDCDTILVLDQSGRLAAEGRHSELMQSCELYRSIAVSQLGEEAVICA